MVSVDHTMTDQEDEVDASAHQKLLAGINSLVRTQDIKKASRTEPSVNKSEFHLVKRHQTEAGDDDGDGDQKKSSSTVNVGDLLGLLKKTTKNTEVAKDLARIKKKRKTLQEPLAKPVADRIGRDVLYGKAQKNLDLWEPVVTASDFAPQTVFPLQYGDLRVEHKAPQKLSQYRVKSDLMKAMEELDRKYKGEDSPVEEVDKYELTLEELRQKRKEAARQKMREAYKIAKGRRMNKIKSKKFHRLMKRDKIRAQIKQFEELQKTDPEAALKQLELIEKQRYQERVSLRHKNTGSWAKNMQIRAQYDMDVRKELSEQLSIGKELMAKRLLHEDSSDSGEEEEVDADGDDNPWVGKLEEPEANREFTSGYRKYWEQRNKAKEEMKRFNEEQAEEDDEDEMEPERQSIDQESEQDSEESEDEVQLELFKKEVKKSKAISTSAWEEEDIYESEAVSTNGSQKKKNDTTRKELNVEELFDDAEHLLQQRASQKIEEIREQTKSRPSNRNKPNTNGNLRKSNKSKSSGLEFKKIASLADADVELAETAHGSDQPKQVVIPSVFADDEQPSASSTPSEVLINTNQFVSIRSKHLLTAVPDMTTGGELSDEEDPEVKQKLTIAEAFENDDIVADFEKEKQDERNRTKPQEVDTFLPGWGSWAGAGISERKTRKNRRKLFKAPPVLPRRDDNKERVIINEEGLNKKLTAHLVNELPFPFVSVKDYEASLRAPLGRTFVPETAHSTLVEPRVVTKMGAVIEPMKKDILLQEASKSFKVGGKMFNKAVQKYEAFLEKKDEVE
ncbi:U3 small nucleolar RNA-associated protein 14 homolog A [Toxorhynchites rutilus septentrionalis]|uniref:U3 small nucleolar RNA-associated protein 14 homolog A n=1 Tax=Toxorhynchites rutilus septentrionalis TaxID=329112 RepID=UPI00247842FE|nr:U3 small nucleolar RNA-associated protein 14 homolog A [Toxorhynchites rutilus septentrionalis]